MTTPCPHADTIPDEVVGSPTRVPEDWPVITVVGRKCIACREILPPEKEDA